MRVHILVEHANGEQKWWCNIVVPVLMEDLKRQLRACGARVVAIARRKVREPRTYDSAGVEDE